jgi:hypothetical protein
VNQRTLRSPVQPARLQTWMNSHGQDRELHSVGYPVGFHRAGKFGFDFIAGSALVLV